MLVITTPQDASRSAPRLGGGVRGPAPGFPAGGIYVITPGLRAAQRLLAAANTSPLDLGEAGLPRHEHVQPENPRRRGVSSRIAHPPAASLGRPHRAPRRRL